MGTFDGPGLRFVVFLQGCPFRCLYCANPDTIDPVGESKLTDPDYIYDQVVSMKAFFGRRGGVTFSGGEPTVQAEALVPLCQRLKEAGFHICIDSNGTVWNEHVEALFRTVDLVLLDVKEIDPERHETITSRSNARTLETAAWLEREGHPFWLRYVLVPGLSNDDDHLHRLGRHFADYKQIERVELLPYHTLGVHKYEAMGLDYKLKGIKENTPKQLDHAAAILRTYFPQLVVN